jgi:ABC-type Fe3+-hydroxamate transport system substrate-binding protein
MAILLGPKLDHWQQPKRIVSLVPSLTETLIDLGLGKCIVGRTRFCIHPSEAVRNIERIGGTKDFSVERILKLKPDLIIGSQEENHKEGIEALQAELPVWLSTIDSVDTALKHIGHLGKVTGTAEEADLLMQAIDKAWKGIPRSPSSKRVAYFIWQNPWMIAGKGTYIDSVLARLGWTNVTKQERYPEIRMQQLAKDPPELFLFSSEPFPFKKEHWSAWRAAFPKAQFRLVNGEDFSWYGSRMLEAAERLSAWARDAFDEE